MSRRVLAIAVLGALLCSVATASTTKELLLDAVKGVASRRAGPDTIKQIFLADCVSMRVRRAYDLPFHFIYFHALSACYKQWGQISHD